jgi:hypothetical protein
MKVPEGISLNVIPIGWSSHPTVVNNINKKATVFVMVSAQIKIQHSPHLRPLGRRLQVFK